MAPRAMYVKLSLTSTFTSKQSAPLIKRLMPGRSLPPNPADAASNTGLPFHFFARLVAQVSRDGQMNVAA